MAFSYTRFTDRRGKLQFWGNMRVAMGSWANAGGSTGGDITVRGFKRTVMFQLVPAGSAVQANAPVVNETLPLAGNVVTIVTDADKSGYWIAYGI